MAEFSLFEWIALGLIFVWTGFVRTGIGFGGAALGLPLMLLLKPDPLFFLPVIAVHLLFFSALTLRTRLRNVDWRYLWRSFMVMLIPKLLGILGLLSLPPRWMTLVVFGVTFAYALMYIFDWALRTQHPWVDRVWLVVGGYISGTSLIGAPLIVAVYLRHVAMNQLRDTLLVLWFILVTIKLSAFIVVGVDLHLDYALVLLPLAAIGHFFGLKAHDQLLRGGQRRFKRWVGVGMLLVTLVGLGQVIV
ncbi:MAG: TSUP family transporter [Thiotrichales bacterium]